MEDNIEDLTDRISQVPESIIHHIMSFLDSPKDLVRMSVLSKNLFSLTASFPNLDLDVHKLSSIIWDTRFMEIMSSGNGTSSFDLLELYTRQSFLQYVVYTTFRFCQQNVTRGHTLKLITKLQDPTIIDLTYRCLRLILTKGVQVLEIDITNRNLMHIPPYGPIFRLPDILLSVSSLTSLKLCNCVQVLEIDITNRNLMHIPPYGPIFRLPDILLSVSSLTSLKLCNCEWPSSLMVNGVKFKSLKLLRLEYLRLDEEVIKILTTSCPLLEELTVIDCSGFKRFCVYGLQNLQIVRFCYEKCDTAMCELASCKKLTTLHYSGYPFPSSKGFTDLSSHFPFLENLFLDLPDGCNSLKLSSHSLKTFVLCSECELEDIDINAPNLLLFEYIGYLRMFGSMVTNPVPLKACMIFDSSYYVDTLLFKNLRRFLDKKIKFRELKLKICDHIDDFEELKLIQSAPYELEHVDLDRVMIQEVPAYLALVEAILWCSLLFIGILLKPPHMMITISLALHSISCHNKVDNSLLLSQFTSEKLLQQEDEGKINIRLEMCWSSKAKKQFSDINSLLAALPGS
ncbi:F-box domain containing protein [Tanacetum coccineum]